MNRKTLTHPLLLAVLWIACLFVQPVAGQPHDLAPAAPQPAPAAVAAAPAMRPSVSTADVDAFAAQLDLTKLGQLAVHAEGRLKSFDSHARAAMQLVTGPKKIHGRSPTFTFLDMMLRPDAYIDSDVVYFKQKLMRAQVVRALREGFRADLESLSPEMRPHAEAAMASLNQRLDDFVKEGLISPRILADPRVQEVMGRLSTDLLRSAKFVDKIEQAMSVMDPQVLRANLHLAPPPAAPGEDVETLRNRPWLTLDELADPNLVIPQDKLDPQYRQRLMIVWANFTEGWKSLNAPAVNDAAAQLAALLPPINPAIYPDQSRLSWESWYFRMHNLTWVWIIYGFAILPLLLAVVFKWPAARWIGLLMFLGAFGLHTFAVMLRWYVADRWPNSNMFEAVTTAAWFGGCLAVILELFVRRLPLRNLFALGSATASAVAFMAVSFFPLSLSPNISNMMPVLDDLWLYIHTNVIIFSYCLIFIAAVVAALYLGYRAIAFTMNWSNRTEYARVGGAGSLILTRPDGTSYIDAKRSTFGQVLDGTTMVVMEMSFILLWAGLVMGAIWADHSWGRPWGWDPKEVFALNTFIVFLLLVHVRLKVKDKGLWTAILAVVGAAVMLFNWIIINFAISGLHSYA